MENKKTLYLHVGFSKTGTSYIQSSLAYNREWLREQGLYYPLFSETYGAKYGLINSGNGQSLAQLLNPSLRKTLFLETIAWRMVENLRQCEENTILISSEFLMSAQPEYLEKLKQKLPDVEIRILIFVRSFLERTYANWSQAIKRHGSTKELDHIIGRASENYNKKIMKFVKVFGANNVLVYNYDRRRETLLETIADTVGISSINPPPFKIINRSLTARETARMLYINRLSAKNSPEQASKISTIVSDLFIEVDTPEEEKVIVTTEEAWKSFCKKNKKILNQLNNKVLSSEAVELALSGPRLGKIVLTELSSAEKKTLDAIHESLSKKRTGFNLDISEVEKLNEPSIYILVARLYLKQNKIKQAIWAAEKAVSKVPNEPRALFELARGLGKNKDYQAAILRLNKAIAAWSDKPGYYRYMAYLLFCARRWKDSLRALNMMLKLYYGYFKSKNI